MLGAGGEPASSARDVEETEQLVPHCFPPPELLLFSISIALREASSREGLHFCSLGKDLVLGGG